MSQTAEVVVVGGGVNGASIAYALALHPVVIFFELIQLLMKRLVLLGQKPLKLLFGETVQLDVQCVLLLDELYRGLRNLLFHWFVLLHIPPAVERVAPAEMFLHEHDGLVEALG